MQHSPKVGWLRLVRTNGVRGTVPNDKPNGARVPHAAPSQQLSTRQQRERELEVGATALNAKLNDVRRSPNGSEPTTERVERGIFQESAFSRAVQAPQARQSGPRGMTHIGSATFSAVD